MGEPLLGFASYLSVGLCLLGVVLLVVLLAERQVMDTRVGKLSLLVSSLVIPSMAVYATTSTTLHRSQQTSFCLSCHVMESHGKSLLVDDDELIPSVHYRNNWVRKDQACWECHTDYTMYGPIAAKMRGLRHLYAYYAADPSKRLKLYGPYQNRECLRCHGDSEHYSKSEYHNQEEGMLLRINSGRQSCIEQGCHDAIHDVYDDN